MASAEDTPDEPANIAERPIIQKLAVPAVCFLIAFLAYPSQLLLGWLDPGPLSTKEALWLNGLSICIWISYYRAVNTDPGRLPQAIKDAGVRDLAREKNGQSNWCSKCDAVKPPRAHHCKICKRCIPKMDHHCPWTSTCTSHTTLPPFLRFLFWATISLSLLLSHLWVRLTTLWAGRHISYEYGPSMFLIGWLLYVTVVTGLLAFILFVLFVTSVRAMALNETSIETREMERHEVLLNRARQNGGYVYAPGGSRIAIQRQEFPYDIGIWKNIVQGMGTANVLRWFLPWEKGNSNETGWAFETNGFEDEGTFWPPPDPEKVPVKRTEGWKRGMEIQDRGGLGVLDGSVEAVKRRQEADLRRRRPANGKTYEWLNLNDPEGSEDEYGDEDEPAMDQGWWKDGKAGSGKLDDLGVDESTERYIDESESESEDDIPLSELRQRLKGKTSQQVRVA